MKTSTPYWTRVCRNGIKRRQKGKRPFRAIHIKLAGKWVTCACGKQDPRIPRATDSWLKNSFWMPRDCRLAALGREFFDAIYEQNPYKAFDVLCMIERRSAKVITEQGFIQLRAATHG